LVPRLKALFNGNLEKEVVWHQKERIKISNLLSMSKLLQKSEKFTSQSLSCFKIKRTEKQD